MPNVFHIQIHGRGEQVHVETAMLTAGVLIFTMLMIVILFFGALMVRGI